MVTKRTSMVKVPGGGAEAVTLKVTGESEPELAATVWVAAFPSRQALSRACPSKSVVAVAPVSTPSPWVAVNVTGTPATGFP